VNKCPLPTEYFLYQSRQIAVVVWRGRSLPRPNFTVFSLGNALLKCLFLVVGRAFTSSITLFHRGNME
jgi:hypothetical protein